MLQQKIIVMVMSAYNSAQTLDMTDREIPKDVVDEVILVDDASLARFSFCFLHDKNWGCPRQ